MRWLWVITSADLGLSRGTPEQLETLLRQLPKDLVVQKALQCATALCLDKKDEYLKLYDQVRAGTFKALDTVKETDFDKPGPEKFREYCPTVASVFLMQPSHWLMHAGQWSVVRRKLGKPPLF